MNAILAKENNADMREIVEEHDVLHRRVIALKKTGMAPESKQTRNKMATLSAN